jgi:hypothetical protein
MNLDVDACYVPSEDVVAREIEGEMIIVPLTAGIGDMEDDLYTLNETGKIIWQKLDGKMNVKAVVDALLLEYEAPEGEIERDVIGLMQELLSRKMLVQITG